MNIRALCQFATLPIGAIALIFGMAVIAAETPEVDILASTDGISVEFSTQSARDVLTFNVRVVGPNQLLFQERVHGSVLQWIPPDDLADGWYNWEAWVVTVDRTALMREITPELARRSADHWFETEDKQTHLISGSFRVENGLIHQVDQSREAGEGSSPIRRVASAILNFLVPSAQAQNFTDDVVVTKNVPEVRYQHNGPSPRNWATGFNPLTGWYVRDLTANTFPFVVEPAAPNGSIRIMENGSVRLLGGHWDTAGTEGDFRIGTNDLRLKMGVATGGGGAGNATIAAQGGTNTLFLGSGTTTTDHRLVAIRTGRVGIGTSDPQDLLHLNRGGGEQIRLSDAIGTVRLEGFNNRFSIMDGSSLTPRYGFSIQAPENSIRAIASGDVGFGTAAPAAPIHVQRVNNSARVLVQDSGASDPGGGQTMFELINNGHPKFMMEDTSQANVRWEFRTAGTQGSNERFQINKLGSGVVEARIFAGGDAEFAGNVTANGVLLTSTREAKTDFQPLNVHDVLEKLVSLDISQWRYKNESEETRHIGPIAEEFHEVFGLSDGKTLNMIDTNGIAFAAIKALSDENKKLSGENQKLAERLDRLEAALKVN